MMYKYMLITIKKKEIRFLEIRNTTQDFLKILNVNKILSWFNFLNYFKIGRVIQIPYNLLCLRYVFNMHL